MNINRLFLSSLLTISMSLSAYCSDNYTKDEKASLQPVNQGQEIQVISLEQAVQLGMVDPQLQQRLALFAAANQPVLFHDPNGFGE